MMKTHYTIKLVPRQQGTNAVVATFRLELEVALGPELRGSLEHAFWEMKHPENAPGGFYRINPFGPDPVPVRIDEITEALKLAFDIAETTPSIPANTALIVIDKDTEEAMSLQDFGVLDGRLRRLISVRVEGARPPFSLVFTSGLSNWRLSASTETEAQTIAEHLEGLATAVSTPEDATNFITDEDERKTIIDTLIDGARKLRDAWLQAKKEEAEADAEHAKYILNGFKEPKEHKEPVVREGEPRFIRGDKVIL